MICKTIDIWRDLPYEHSGTDDFRPFLNTYVLDLSHRETSEGGIRPRPAVLVLPGGGYGFTSPREGEPIALKFASAGFHAFVLHYRVSPNRHPKPLLDASRAVHIIREKADAWNIVPDKIIVCGFSAGGHLAASLGVHWDKAFLSGIPGLAAGRNKPFALILGYPVISSGPNAHQGSFKNLLGGDAPKELYELMCLDRHVGPQTPPAFLWHTQADAAVPVENSLLFAGALQKAGLPFELHIYPDGPHGLSLADEETAHAVSHIVPRVQSWMQLAVTWLRALTSN
jgi:acetyl esterase/lipase